MPIILPRKSFEVFGRTVEFSPEELLKYKNDGLEIPDGSILEFFLIENNVFDFPESFTERDIHRACAEAIEHYGKICEVAAKILYENPEAGDPITMTRLEHYIKEN